MIIHNFLLSFYLLIHTDCPWRQRKWVWGNNMKHDLTPFPAELFALEAWSWCGVMAEDGNKLLLWEWCSLCFWSFEKVLESNSLESGYSLFRCDLRTSSVSISWELIRNAESQLNWDLHFTKVPTGSMSSLNFGKFWSRLLVSQNDEASESPLELIKNYRILVPAP